MKIKRYLVDSLRMVRDDDVDRTAIVIDLTEEELLKAYREQEHIFQLNDAYNQLCDYLGFMGVKLDPELNKSRGKEMVISTPDSKVQVWVVPTNEELMIAQDTAELVNAAK